MKTILIALLAFGAFNQAVYDQLAATCHDLHANQRKAIAKKAEMVEAVVTKYKVDKKLAKDVVTLAMKYEKQTFPKAKDIVAIIGVESAFNPNAKSKLKKDPAEGLTQIRPAAWSHKIKREELANIDGQVKHGAQILAHYYKVLDGNKAGAIRAYNIGLRNYQEGKFKDAADRYIAKYGKEVVIYQKIEAQYAK